MAAYIQEIWNPIQYFRRDFRAGRHGSEISLHKKTMKDTRQAAYGENDFTFRLKKYEIQSNISAGIFMKYNPIFAGIFMQAGTGQK